MQPPNTTESEGHAVLNALFRGLIDYNPETSEPQFTGVAASIESPDEGLTWEIALNEGWTFHDGTPVTAQSFVDSWNYSAYGPNATQVRGSSPRSPATQTFSAGLSRSLTRRPVRMSTSPIARASPPQRKR